MTKHAAQVTINYEQDENGIPTSSVTVQVDGREVERQEFDDHSGNFWNIVGDIYNQIIVAHVGLE